MPNEALPSWEECVPFLNAVIGRAVSDEAEAIHFHPTMEGLELRMRQLGILRDVESLPREARRRLIDRIKVMSSLDVEERQLPQDGRIKIRVADRHVDLRVCIFPTAFGERAVLRILSNGPYPESLETLGMDATLAESMDDALRARSGMFLVVGPTGSGLSTTLCSLVGRFGRQGLSSIYVGLASPPEGANCSHYYPRPWLGLDGDACSQSALRGDGDVLLLDELADGDTAATLFQAAARGRFVVASMHARDALEAIERLLDLGVAPSLLSSSLRMIVNQRTVALTCPDCRRDGQVLAPSLRRRLAWTCPELCHPDVRAHRAEGCPVCGGTGRRAWRAFFEIQELDEGLRSALREERPLEAVKAQMQRRGSFDLARAVARAGVEGEIDEEDLHRLFAAGLSTLHSAS